MSIDASIALFGSLGECKIESLDSDKKILYRDVSKRYMGKKKATLELLFIVYIQ